MSVCYVLSRCEPENISVTSEQYHPEWCLDYN